jgi:hypothetical protein
VKITGSHKFDLLHWLQLISQFDSAPEVEVSRWVGGGVLGKTSNLDANSVIERTGTGGKSLHLLKNVSNFRFFTDLDPKRWVTCERSGPKWVKCFPKKPRIFGESG